MRHFETPEIRRRKLSWGEIVFSSKFHITVNTPDYTIVFHRYGAPAGHYTKEWQAFRIELIRRKLPTIYDVYKKANYYEITHFIKEVHLDAGSNRKIKLGENR